jgi:hypothetical protein
MIVVGSSSHMLAQVAEQTERTLSARQAVAAVGFEQTLGSYSVHHGTDMHKRIIKDTLHGKGKLDAEIPFLHAAVRRAFETEFGFATHEAATEDGDGGGGDAPAPASIAVSDLLSAVRRCVLRATVERLLGAAVLRLGGEALVTDFMRFQVLIVCFSTVS